MRPIQEFTYSIDATGRGFTNFYVQFKNTNLLTLAQIGFIVHCRMKDEAGFWQDGPPLMLTRVNIRGENS